VSGFRAAGDTGAETVAASTADHIAEVPLSDAKRRGNNRTAQKTLGDRIGVTGWRLIALALVLIIWQLVSIPAGNLLLPSPLEVGPAFLSLLVSGQLLTATASSVMVFAAGFLLAIVTAVPLGILMGGLPRLGETLDIYVNGLNATPRVALIPLIILWLGLGFPAKVAIVWFAAALPIAINTYAGVLNADPELIEAARSFGASRGQIFRSIMLPCALPYIMAGLRIGASLAIIGTVIAELYTALSGLGSMLAKFGGSFQTAKYFVPVLVLVVIGVVISQSLKTLERRVAPWKGTGVQL
jgi:ABC-type nitrate/sulfonate/bicarbonate transport system permease component